MEHALKTIQLIWNLLLLLLKIWQNKLKWVFNLKCRNRVNISAKKLCIDEKSSAQAWTSVLIAQRLRLKNKQKQSQKCLSLVVKKPLGMLLNKMWYCSSCEGKSKSYWLQGLWKTNNYTPGWNVWGECLFYEVNDPLLQVCYKP